MTSKSNGVEHVDWVRTPPQARPFCVRVAKAIYDSDEKTFLGRTAKRWGIVFAFYLVFYAVLAVMFAICMAGLFYHLPADRPAFTLHQSLIGASPGVAYRPRGPLSGQGLQYDVENVTHYQQYIDQLDEYLMPYRNLSWFPVTSECSADENYGYPHTPCFFIKLNIIIDWVPEYYGVADLPADMPDDLKQHIQSLNTTEQQQLWVSCAAEGGAAGAADAAGAGAAAAGAAAAGAAGAAGAVRYPWGRALLGAGFPRRTHAADPGAMLPVKITAAVNTPVAIRCWTWARNVIRSKSLKEPAGYTRILLHIEDHSRKSADQQAQ